MVVQPPTRPMDVLYIGAISDEFREVVRWLGRHSRLTVSPNMSDAERRLADGASPVLFVLAQSYAGQYAPTQVLRLCGRAPLARLICVAGAWCDGEMRGGQPVADALRVHWHDWRPRLEAEWDRWRAGRCPSWGIAPSATDDERFAWQVDDFCGDKSKMVGVVSACQESAQALAEMVEAIGFTPRQATGTKLGFLASASLVIWDDTVAPRATGATLRETVRACHPTPLLALTSFARQPDIENALDGGAAGVLTKPIKLADLAWLLQHRIPRAAAESGKKMPAA